MTSELALATAIIELEGNRNDALNAAKAKLTAAEAVIAAAEGVRAWAQEGVITHEFDQALTAYRRERET